MNIPWKLKSSIFGLIDFFNAPSALYFLQKYVTKRSKIGNLSISESWENHKNYLRKYGATQSIFEFGAGKNLAQNFYLSDVVDHQLVVDINPMLDLDQLNEARKQISRLVKLKSSSNVKRFNDLVSYGIQYKAPYDASKTDLSDKTLDACISTNTLEHIPKESIISIFDELFRKLKDDGIVSAKIDYSDHYAHTDRNISLLNYLKFDEYSWRKYNHGCHFQNRLRHYDYIDIFNSCGFSIVEEEVVFGEKNIPTELIEKFKDKDETWMATSAHLLLQKVKK